MIILVTSSGLISAGPCPSRAGVPELGAAFQVGSHKDRAEGQDALLCPAGDAAFGAAQGTGGFWAASAHCLVLLTRFPVVSC